ncbi:hypothetical protein MF672_014165 [Actinomadura sp. ATCC 31491]|uniref:Uncharacterized protein n=1 Tax=Actinomadura luzonensis TaxID=2805427 RepID=A0ABT0FSR3_9ACTN|nr:hypothetical protein [Actinomadura luzonensis]MCK2214921.1 hypothetical protein [Actinomadura luzonensis]
MTELGGWLRAANLKGFMLALSEIIAYDFDDSDWDAIAFGLERDAEKDAWFTYPLGHAGLTVTISKATEEGTIDLRIAVPDGIPCLREKIDVAWMVFNQFDVNPDVEIL